ncbi:MAG: tRNA (adenosine(37)-N6)-dimethylallyltransferase MiaA [Deltaproteobacteria bacterium]|nr:tRNA (adenosine(37)-N6)-dimethylallyltransferase MiaA [Deltaproteobacteria bacterium]
MNPWIVIVGPTAVGKSELADNLALAFNGEIISCDSQLFYKGMDIGTAKPLESKAPMHMIDCALPSEAFDVNQYRTKTLDVIAGMSTRKKSVFIVGGSGFYLRALLKGVYETHAPDNNFRKLCVLKDLKTLYDELCDVDPQSALSIHPNDKYRIVRALEVFNQTGKKLSQIKSEFEKKESHLNFLKIGLTIPKTQLHVKIEKRVDLMFENGWVQEVQNLLQTYQLRDIASKGIGYGAIIDYLQKNLSFEECRLRIIHETKQLAKKQMTWFRADKTIQWFHPQFDNERISWVINFCFKNGPMSAF